MHSRADSRTFEKVTERESYIEIAEREREREREKAFVVYKNE